MTVPLYPKPVEGDSVDISYWVPTNGLRWVGRDLQQLWSGSNGKQEWRPIPEEYPHVHPRP